MSGSILCVVVEAWWRPVCCSGGLCSGGLCVAVEACSGGLCVVVEACSGGLCVVVEACVLKIRAVHTDCGCKPL